MECLWLCFSALIQKVLNEVKEHWNTHLIRKSRHDTVNGRQDSLFYLPEIRGGTQFLLPMTEADRQYAHCHIVETEEHNDYQEYFQYVSEVCTLEQPNDWRDALQLYNFIVQCARSGEE